MQRIALGIEYNGANYSGWQKQHHKPSIQEHIEFALFKIANHAIAVCCAGRTDAGVHASSQVIHFDTSAIRDDIAWIRGVNTYLPRDIRVCWVKKVPAHFNARRSALYRRYGYIILNRKAAPGIVHQGMTWILPSLDVHLMQQGAQYLVGTKDFAAFRAAQCQAKSSIRTVHKLTVTRQGDLIILDVIANAFLHHMVRNIAGTLIAVGLKKEPIEWVEGVLNSKERAQAGVTASPHGLYLMEVGYPDEFDIPSKGNYPWFFSGYIQGYTACERYREDNSEGEILDSVTGLIS